MIYFPGVNVKIKMKKQNNINSWEHRYGDILFNTMFEGVHRADRTGVGSKSLFNQQISINLGQGRFPMITGRKMFKKIFETEFDWFMNGETNIRRFKEAGVKIWDNWADMKGNLGPVYGYQMLNFNNESINQLKAVIHSLKHDRDSRRHIISLWNPAQTHLMALPPCYLYFQFFVDKDEKLNMFIVQRSGDLFLGIPYDIALFSKILLYICAETLYLPGVIDLQIVDAHVYDNQHNAIIKYLSQNFLDQPKYTYYKYKLKIKNYQHGPVISAPVAV